jgi:4-amino-4-deoxy-L-arabinose transferase-like glycosyltransferase
VTVHPPALSDRISFTNPLAVVSVAAIAALYLVTRLLLLWRFPPFWDEAQYAGWTHQGFVDSHFRFVALANGKQPMLPWLGMSLMTLGVGPLTAVRLVSALSGLVTLTMMGLVGHRLGGLRVGLVAAAGGAVVPYLFVHNSMGLMEPLVAATAMTALYLQLRLAEQPRLDFALLLGIVLAVGLLTKETGRFALVLLPLSLLCFRWNDPAWPARLALWGGYAAVAFALAGIGYSILRLSDLYQEMERAGRAIGLHRDYGEALRHPGRWAERNWPLFRAGLGGYLTAPIVVTAAVGAALGLRSRPRLTGVLIGWALIVIGGGTLLAGLPFPRYILVSVPPIVILAAYGIVRVVEAVGARAEGHRRLAAAAVVAIAVVPALVFDARVLVNPGTTSYPALDDRQFATGGTAGHAWVEVAKELERRLGRRPAVVQLAELSSPALGLLLLDRPNIELVGGTDPRTRAARFAIENGPQLRRENGLVRLRPVFEVHRPRGGRTLTLLERGVAWDGRFYADPDALRAGLGLPDEQFDAFVASHPEVQAWYAGALAEAE